MMSGEKLNIPLHQHPRFTCSSLHNPIVKTFPERVFLQRCFPSVGRSPAFPWSSHVPFEDPAGPCRAWHAERPGKGSRLKRILASCVQFLFVLAPAGQAKQGGWLCENSSCTISRLLWCSVLSEWLSETCMPEGGPWRAQVKRTRLYWITICHTVSLPYNEQVSNIVPNMFVTMVSNRPRPQKLKLARSNHAGFRAMDATSPYQQAEQPPDGAGCGVQHRLRPALVCDHCMKKCQAIFDRNLVVRKYRSICMEGPRSCLQMVL